MFVTTIHLAADHAGLLHKDAVCNWLQSLGLSVVDHGPHTFDPLDDFPDTIAPAARAVAAHPLQEKAIVFGGSGQGEAMVANRFPALRAAVYYGGPDDIITLSRTHNDANVLSIGARFVSVDDAKRVIWLWLHTSVADDQKYVRRNTKLSTVPS
jgi:ribose 5-phosphate isomerase B